MGMSPSADLFWGYDYGGMIDDWEELRPEWMTAHEENWEELLAVKLGWVEVSGKRPTDDYHETAEYKAWSDNRDELHRINETLPVELGTYGDLSMDETVYFVCPRASRQSVYGYRSIRLEPLVVAPEWPEQLARFMELLELPVPDEPPTWHVGCSYG